MPPSEPMQHRARTKIVATVGPACGSDEMLADLIAAGADVFRLNMAHGDRAEHERNLASIRRVAAEAGRPVAVLVDLSGPKIRLGQLVENPTACPRGETFRFIRGDAPGGPRELTSNYPPLVDELAVGDTVMLADGLVGMKVRRKEADAAVCEVIAAGDIRSRQGINLPGVKLSVPALTEADLDAADWAARQSIDFVSLSFVRSANDLRQLKERLRDRGSRAMVVAKIEKREALEQLDDIVYEADAVMVARGDLGVEIDVAETPMVQKRITALCRRLCKPVIVATQMLDSMHENRRPTRAEATDVANAILDGADACMLSGETAIGEFPREAVEMMNRIMLATERMLHDEPPQAPAPSAAAHVHPITSACVYGAARIAAQLCASLVVIATRSGATARVKAKQRDFIPAVGVSDSEETLRQMCLFWGVTPLRGAPVNDLREFTRFIYEWGKEDGVIAPGDRVVFLTGSSLVTGAHNLVVVHEVE